MKNLYIKLSIFLIACSTTGCSDYLYEQANDEFYRLRFSEAIRDYNKVLEKKDIHDARINLANSYRLINDLEAAEPLFAVIVNYPESKAINMLHYARILMSRNDYENAQIWVENYINKVPGDEVAMILWESCCSANLFKKDTTLFTVNQINMPGFESAFGQVPYRDGTIFSADKEAFLKSDTDPWTGKSFYDLYYSEKDTNGQWLEAKPLTGEINGRYHDGPAVFNKAGDVGYFTRSNYFKHKLLKSSRDENNLKLFTAQLVNEEWTELEVMPFSSDEFSVGHPALSADEQTLYFISDMPGGLGGTDLYKSVHNGSTWGEPENLGKNINTQGDEMFPFASDDGKLYFSSNAHMTMGGLDIFSSSYDSINNTWNPVENLPYPLNTEHDDFAFVMNENHKSGYLSSNRNSPDNIYEFKMNEPVFNLFGIVIDKMSRIPIQNAAITLTDQTNNTTVTVQTDSAGAYKMELMPETDFAVSASKEYFLIQGADVSTKDKKYSEDFERNFELDGIVFTLFGKVIGKESRIPIENASITVSDETDDIPVTDQTDTNGMYKMKLKPDAEFKILASKEKFLTQSASVSTMNKINSEDFERNFELDSLILQKPIVVENIYYDYNRWEIRPDAALELNKLVTTLNDNPAINIEMGSHADSRGSDSYNLKLTDKRAKSAVDYLASQGIDANRLTWKGYGESKMLNHCKNKVECTDEEHQRNRRTEFMITGINQLITNSGLQKEGIAVIEK